MSSVIAKILTEHAEKRIKQVFENLRDNDFEITSPFDPKYNCIAHVAGDDSKWWWSVDTAMVGNDVFWFNNVPSQETLENFILAFGKLDYEPCVHSEIEENFEKVAIYVTEQEKLYIPKRTPTHMARQLPTGIWTSKLGQDVDISHNSLQNLEGKTYGKVGQILKRPIKE